MADKIGWDVDFYLSRSDDLRIISLSDKEIYLLGQISQMVEWQSRWEGDTSALDLSAIRGNIDFALLDEEEGGGAMSCLDVADCIETDETVQAAIEQTVINNGYTPNTDMITENVELPPLISQSALDENLISLVDCADNPEQAMGLARAIVKELHESSEDILELIEYATNSVEAWALMSDSVPTQLTNVLAQVLGWVDWILDTLKDLYAAAYTQSVEDELTCAIFCHIIDNCSLSLSDLKTIYAAESSIGTPPSGLIETLEFIYTVATSADKIAVAAFHYQILSLLSWGKFGAMSPVYIKSLLTSGQANDYSYQTLCDDCVEPEVPTLYWKIQADFRGLGMQGFDFATATNTYFDNGFIARRDLGTPQQNMQLGIPDLGGSFVIRAMGVQQVRNGSSGNGTHDYSAYRRYPNANYGGTLSNLSADSFISANGNDLYYGQLTNSVSARSLLWYSRLNKASSGESGGYLRTYRAVAWGEPDGLGNKPPMAIWAGDTLPVSTIEMFELP